MKPAQARVLLTGASGGIGQAMATALGRAGARVMGVGRGAQPAPACHAWVQADITHDEAADEVASQAAAWQANVLVHAAGLPGFGALASLPAATLAAVLQTNLLAPMRITQALLPHLLGAPRAQIVFVGSALGRIGVPGFSVYGASKSGLHGFAEALRRELAGSTVRVQTLGPRSTRTGFNDAAVQAFNQATGTASDSADTVAAALLALIASEDAERFIGLPERLAVRVNGLLGPALDGSFAKHRRSLPQAPGLPVVAQGVLS